MSMLLHIYFYTGCQREYIYSGKAVFESIAFYIRIFFQNFHAFILKICDVFFCVLEDPESL